MKKTNIMLLITLCASLQINTSYAGQRSKHQSKKVSKQLQKERPQELLERPKEEISNLPLEGLSQQQLEQPSQNIQQSSYWRTYAPQFLQNTGDYVASWIPQSFKDKVNSLNRKQKIGLLSTLIGVLALYYKKDDIMAFVDNTFERSAFINEAKALLESWTEDKTIDPISRYTLKGILVYGDNKELERLLGEAFDSKDMSSNQDRFNFLFDAFGLKKSPKSAN